MPRITRRKKRNNAPKRRIAEKIAIWNAHKNPVGFKFAGKAKIGNKWKHFEFSVIEERKMNRKMMFFWVKKTIQKMAFHKKLPSKCYYHAYNGFRFLHGLEWIDIEDVTYDFRHTAT